MKKFRVKRFPNNFNPYGRSYAIEILHDNRPKRPQLENPHFLIVPEGNLGGYDGSNVPIELRTGMFLQAQRIMQALRTETDLIPMLLLNLTETYEV